MEKEKFNRRGDITDMFVFLIVLFILAVGLLVIVYTNSEIVNGFLASGLNETAEQREALDGLDNFGKVTLQRGFLFLLVGLIISTMITSFLARTHPIWMFLYIIMLGLTVFIGIYLGSTYQDVKDMDIFSSIIESQGILNFIMDNLITIVVVVGILSMIIVFSKFKTSGGSTQI